MNYGYIRVSTKDQNEDRQFIALSESHLKIDKIYAEKISGRDFERKEYKKLVRRLKKDDVIVVKSIDRFGRNYSEIIEQWRQITKVKGADIVVLDMPILDTRQSKDLLGTLISDLVLQLLSYVAENERINIKERQAEGIAAAKAKGVKFGRPQKYNALDYLDIFEKRDKGEISVEQAISIMGVSESTYYRMRRSAAAEMQRLGTEVNNVGIQNC